MKTVHIIASIVTAAAMLATTTPALASQRSTVKVINNSSYNVVAIHSSPKYRTGYGSTDLLGRYTLRSGYYQYVDFESDDAENECVQDILAKASNGSTWKRTMNVCTTTTWTLTD